MQHFVPPPPPPLPIMTSSPAGSPRQRRFATYNSILCQAAALCVSSQDDEDYENNHHDELEPEAPDAMTTAVYSVAGRGATKRSSSFDRCYYHPPAGTGTPPLPGTISLLPGSNSGSHLPSGGVAVSSSSSLDHDHNNSPYNKRVRRTSSDLSSLSSGGMRFVLAYQQGAVGSSTFSPGTMLSSDSFFLDTAQPPTR
jgi:hypothetical protein